MRFSVVITCYNNRPALEQSVQAALETTGPETQVILVDNHPPDPNSGKYLQAVAAHPRVTVLDPGRNLGCHEGQRYGLLRARGDHLVKLDDDIVIPPGCLPSMALALEQNPRLAYLSLPWLPDQASPDPGPGERILAGAGYRVKTSTIPVLFGCVMLPGPLWRRHFSFRQPGLYGWEDVTFYPRKAEELGKSFGYLISHPARHLGRSRLTDPLYGMWKVLYACRHPDVLEGDFAAWRESPRLDVRAKQILLSNHYPLEDLEQHFGPLEESPTQFNHRLEQWLRFTRSRPTAPSNRGGV